MSFLAAIKPMTMQDVHDWATARDNLDYARAVARISRHYDNFSLAQIPADLADIKRRLPLKGYDPRFAKTEKAYQAYRRKILAAVKGATGALTEARERRGRQDDWADLLTLLKEHVCGAEEKKTPPVLIGIHKLADLARRDGIEPSNISQDWLAMHRPTLSCNEWSGLQRALRTLDRLRTVPGAAAFLPPTPFPPAEPLRSRSTPGVPDGLAAEIVAWVERAAATEYDPVEEVHTHRCSESDINVKRAALRKYVSALSAAPGFELRADHSLRDILVPDAATHVVRHWSQHDGMDKISARTAQGYLKAIRIVMSRNDTCPAALKAHLAANRYLKDGKQADKEMADSTRKFCEHLLGSTRATLAFLSLHIRLRNKAESLLRELQSTDERQSAQKIEKIRQIGTVAAICAIETRGAPIRIGNALSLRYRGPGQNFHLPTSNEARIIIDLAPSETKNKSRIWAPIARDNMHGLAVMEWYLERIRPLYDCSDANPYLFPAVRGPGDALPYRTLLTWFKSHTREADLPMSPHKFRHGLASLLLERNPGRWDLLERLLDDSPITVRRNYAWVNERAQRTEVQSYILDLSALAQ